MKDSQKKSWRWEKIPVLVFLIDNLFVYAIFETFLSYKSKSSSWFFFNQISHVNL